MNHEHYIVDLVDERGRVVGQKMRREINKRSDRYHTVLVLMVTPRGELVLGGIIEREDLPNVYAHRLGTTVAAIRRNGESAEEAAVRALSRELFIKSPKVKLLGEGPATIDGKHMFVTSFVTTGMPPSEYSTIDLEELKLIPIERFEEDLVNGPDQFAPTLLYVWEKFREKLSPAG